MKVIEEQIIIEEKEIKFNQKFIDLLQAYLNDGYSEISCSEIYLYKYRSETDKEWQDRLFRISEANKLVGKVEYQQYLKLKEKYEK
jgi:hypothetical protein